MSGKVFLYEPDGVVLRAFYADAAPVSIIQGPIGCTDGATEYLTRAGWRRMDEWRGEEVAEWDDGVLRFRRPVGYVDEPCSEMWAFRNLHGVDMVLSDEHRVPLIDGRTGEFRVRTAAAVAAGPGRYFVPTTWRCDVGIPMSDDALRLRVAITADGCFPKRGNQCVVTVRKQRKKDRLRVLLAACGVEWVEHQHSTRPTEIAFAFSRSGLVKGFDDLWGVSSEQAAVILAECIFWDGLEQPDERFYTTRKAEADFIQFCAHACGRRGTIGVTQVEGWSPNYTVHLARGGSAKAKVGLRSDNLTVERVSTTRKYCFATQSGFFLARRNGCVFVTGNSGTSTACVMKIWRIAKAQQPGRDGVRRTRWLVVRNTFDELKRTTLTTWKLWFEQMVGGAFGEVAMTRPYTHHIKVRAPDKTVVDCEVIFLALDVEDDVRKLMSYEVTGIFFNEMQFTPKPVFDEAESRARQGRYPPKVLGTPPTWNGVIGDLNAPTEGHWIPYMRGDVPLPLEMPDDERRQYVKPEAWRFFVQPPGLKEIVKKEGKITRVVGYEPNPEAENGKWLERPYMEVIEGKSKEWIDARVMNRVGLYRAGKPVFPGFSRETHVAPAPLRFNPELPLLVGIDFARNPAAIFGQVLRGQLMILGEWGVENSSAPAYAPQYRAAQARIAPNPVAGSTRFGDPTGDSAGQGTDDTPYRIFASNGVPVIKAPGGNSVSLRISAVDGLLSRLVNGAPALVISPSCSNLIYAMGGGYHYRKLQGQNRHHDQPQKDRAADFADALQYLCLGAGFGTALMEQPKDDRLRDRGLRRREFSLRDRGRRAAG